MTPPPPTRSVRPCLTATALPVSSPQEEPELAKPAQSAPSLSPSPPILIAIEHAQFSPTRHVLFVFMIPYTVIIYNSFIIIIIIFFYLSRSTSPQASIADKEAPPVLTKSPSVVPSPSPVSVITALPQVMPALSSLAARSVAVNSSRPSVVFAHKSTVAAEVKAEVKKEVTPKKEVTKRVEEDDEDENNSDDDEENDADGDDDSEETPSTTAVVERTPVKRERRKPGSRKAISREFIESDEDSPEDRPMRDSPPKPTTEEKVSADFAHKAVAENNLLPSEQESFSNGGKTTSTGRVKTEDDLDVIYFSTLILVPVFILFCIL